MRILFLAPIKKGGPNISLKKLSKYFNSNKLASVSFKSSLSGFLYGIITNKFDVIHTTLPLPFNIWGTPILLNIRGNYKKEISFRNPLAIIYPVSIFFASRIVSPSKYMMDELKIKNYKVIPNFINEDLIKLNPRYLNNNKKIKLCIITKFHFKDKAEGVLKLLKILKKLKINKDIELSIFGSGIYFNEIIMKSKKIDLPKNIQINWMGFKKNLYELISTHDIHTYYSNLDNFPNSILETMAIGIPTITNDIGSVKEFIINNENGFISNSDDEYLKKLEELINNFELRKRIGRNSKKYVENNYLIGIIANNFLEEYKYLSKNK